MFPLENLKKTAGTTKKSSKSALNLDIVKVEIQKMYVFLKSSILLAEHIGLYTKLTLGLLYFPDVYLQI